MNFCFFSLMHQKTLNRKYISCVSTIHCENFSKWSHADKFLSVHFLIFLYFSLCSIISSWHLFNVLRLEGNFSVFFLSGQKWWGSERERWRGRTVRSWIACTSISVFFSTFLRLTPIGCERKTVGEVEGERSACCVCVGDGWGLQVYCSRTGRGQKKRGSSNAYPQTPAPLSDLHFLPWPPTDALHLLEEKFKS